MSKLVAYRYRLYPNRTQQILLNKTMGCVRYYWNSQVATFWTYNKETNPRPEFKTSTELRNEVEWMKEVSVAAVQQKEIDFNRYKEQLFNKSRKKRVGFPQFKKKVVDNHSGYRTRNSKLLVIKYS